MKINFNKLIDLYFMAFDFIKIVRGKDYFHNPEKIGKYYLDKRFYHLDLTIKAEWKGKYINKVPVLHLPSKNKYIQFPGMIVQYGIGCLEKYLITNNKVYLKYVMNVYRWLLKNCNRSGFYNNHFSDFSSSEQYLTNNSGMTQGLVISYIVRLIRSNLISEAEKRKAVKLIHKIFLNMIKPVDQQGTLLKLSKNIYFCEYCTKKPYIVLNGWIFAIYGLIDYHQLTKKNLAKKILNRTLKTLLKSIDAFIVPRSMWSYYDNEKRLCSSAYHNTHICQLKALNFIIKNKTISKTIYTFTKGYSVKNRIRYNLLKILDKIKDRYAYGR